MAQIFGKASNSVARVTLLAIFFGFFGFWGVVYAVYRSPYTTGVNVPLVASYVPNVFALSKLHG